MDGYFHGKSYGIMELLYAYVLHASWIAVRLWDTEERMVQYCRLSFNPTCYPKTTKVGNVQMGIKVLQTSHCPCWLDSDISWSTVKWDTSVGELVQVLAYDSSWFLSIVESSAVY